MNTQLIELAAPVASPDVGALVEAAKTVIERFGQTKENLIFSKRMALTKLETALTQSQAARVPDGFTKALDIRTAQGWKLTGEAVPVLYTDTINDQQVMRDDVWLCTTAMLAAAPGKGGV